LRVDWGDEAIATAGQCLYEARILRGVSEGIAQPLYRGVQAMVEVHKGVCRPELGSEFLAGDYVVGPLQKCEEHLERLVLQLDPRAVPAEFTCLRIDLKGAEADYRFGMRLRQGRSPEAERYYRFG
jgi:hypothetical protein